MKVQLDTELKVIKIEGIVNLGELITNLETWLPNGLWKEFKLETNTIIEWKDSIFIPYYHHPYNPYPWWRYYDITCNPEKSNIIFSTNNNVNNRFLNKGIYNIECNV